MRTLREQDELVAKGIKHSRTGYIESTLVSGGMLLKDVGVSENNVGELVKAFQQDNYALIRAAYAESHETIAALITEVTDFCPQRWCAQSPGFYLYFGGIRSAGDSSRLGDGS